MTTLVDVTDAVVVQRRALAAAVANRIAADPETVGLGPAPAFRVSITTSRRQIALGPLDDGVRHRSDVVAREAAWDPARPDRIDPETLAWAVDYARASLRRVFQRARAQSDQGPTPDATLVHPLALSLLLAHDPDRSRMPVSDRGGRDAGRADRWAVDRNGAFEHTRETALGPVTCAGEAWVGDGVLRVSRFGTILGDRSTGPNAVTLVAMPDKPVTISIPGAMPHAVIAACVGRRLADIVELPRRGVPEIDAAAAGLVVAAVTRLANGVEYRMEPADLVPYDVAADPHVARIMRLAPERM